MLLYLCWHNLLPLPIFFDVISLAVVQGLTSSVIIGFMETECANYCLSTLYSSVSFLYFCKKEGD